MKKGFLFLLGLASLVIIVCEKQVDIEAEKAEVKSMLDLYHKVLETEDIELFSQLTAHDADMVNIGTDAAERIVGWEALKELMQKQFTASETSKLSVKDQVIKVHDSGKVAWFSEIIDWDVMSQDQVLKLEGLRATGVLEKRNGNWVFVQSHYSVPVEGQALQY